MRHECPAEPISRPRIPMPDDPAPQHDHAPDRDPDDRSPVPRILGALVMGLALVTLITLIVTWPGGKEIASPSGQSLDTVLATVTRVEEEACASPDIEGCRRVTFTVEEGDSRGDIGSITVGGALHQDIAITVGDRIRVVETPPESLGPIAGVEVERWSFSDFDRRVPLLVLALLFAGIVLVAGRFKGARALLGLGLSLVVVLTYLVPGLLGGHNAVLIACTAALAVMFLTIPLAHGWGLTTIAATLGTAASLGITVALAVIFTNFARLTGFSDEASGYLSATSSTISIQGLLLAGIVIAALGVLDDVTVSQASTVLALRHANPLLGFGQLFTRALTVGRDHITATVNTLVLAYVGASLPTLLVFTVVDVSAIQAINGENVASQIVGTLVGSIGLMAAMPITTALAALLATNVEADEIDPHAGHTHG